MSLPSPPVGQRERTVRRKARQVSIGLERAPRLVRAEAGGGGHRSPRPGPAMIHTPPEGKAQAERSPLSFSTPFLGWGGSCERPKWLSGLLPPVFNRFSTSGGCAESTFRLLFLCNGLIENEMEGYVLRQSVRWRGGVRKNGTYPYPYPYHYLEFVRTRLTLTGADGE
jgi:hypothetical protein